MTSSRTAPSEGAAAPAPAGDPLIVVRDLGSSYGGKAVLAGVTFTVARGETMVVVGPSGCGKSTLLKCILGLIRPSAGSATVMGCDLSSAAEDDVQAVRRRIGVAFQGAALLNSLTTGENVALPLVEHARLDPATVAIMVRMKLEQVGLGGFEDFLPSELSGGMRKRAGIARALIMDPPCLLLDEPSAGLDPVTAAGLDELLLRLRHAMGLTLLVITHEMASARLIADRVLMLDAGRVRFCGTLDGMLACADPRVRQFLDRRADPEAGRAQGLAAELAR